MNYKDMNFKIIICIFFIFSLQFSFSNSIDDIIEKIEGENNTDSINECIEFKDNYDIIINLIKNKNDLKAIELIDDYINLKQLKINLSLKNKNYLKKNSLSFKLISYMIYIKGVILLYNNKTEGIEYIYLSYYILEKIVRPIEPIEIYPMYWINTKSVYNSIFNDFILYFNSLNEYDLSSIKIFNIDSELIQQRIFKKIPEYNTKKYSYKQKDEISSIGIDFKIDFFIKNLDKFDFLNYILPGVEIQYSTVLYREGDIDEKINVLKEKFGPKLLVTKNDKGAPWSLKIKYDDKLFKKLIKKHL